MGWRWWSTIADAAIASGIRRRPWLNRFG